MADRIATISGTMLAPGVSRNRRLYTPDLIGRAVARMQERIADPAGLPIVMRSHHGAGDDSRLIVGHVTSVKVDGDGKAKYTADLHDTAPARDIAALVTPKDPALRSVSIHGYWLGQVRRERYEGEPVETADDLEINAVDFTATPGVDQALLDRAALEATESADSRTPISESLDATVTVDEAATEPSTVEAFTAKQRKSMATKGQAMGDGSYPIRNKSDLRKAIRAVGRGGADHNKIRAHIIARAKALGLAAMIPDNWNTDGSMTETTTRYGELHEYYPDGPSGAGGFCIDAYNGPLSITLRACGVDPADLRAITAAAMDAACTALQAMDPDMDGDMDVDGAPAEDTDHDNESVTGQQATDEAAALDQIGEAGIRGAAGLDVIKSAAAGAATTDRAATDTVVEATTHAAPATGESTTESEVPAVSEATENQAADTTATRTLSEADMTALAEVLSAALKESLAPIVGKKDKKAKASEKADKGTKAEATESAPELGVAELRESVLAQVRDELREEFLRTNGIPGRKGYRVHESDTAEPTSEELFANRADILLGDFGRTPTPVAGTGSAA